MKLLLTKKQESKGMLSKSINYKLTARASLTDEEQANIDKYKMHDIMLYTNMDDRGSGVLGAISRAAKGIEIKIGDLVNGRTLESKDIVEMMSIEEQIRSACEMFSQILNASMSFEGEAVVDFNGS